MNIHEAAISGKPFSNPDMIGAYMIIDGHSVHRDYIKDFMNLDWIRKYCINPRSMGLDMLVGNDLIRKDWFIVDKWVEEDK